LKFWNSGSGDLTHDNITSDPPEKT
jgi:hypothetical protein